MCIWSGNQFLAQIFTWLLVICGWYVVHFFTLKREQRKETRERVNTLLNSLHDIEAKAMSFHESKEFRGDLARDLRTDIQRLFKCLKRPPFSMFKVASHLRKEFRKSITIRNFEPSNFSCQAADSQILRDIVDAVDDIEEQIEKEFERLYK